MAIIKSIAMSDHLGYVMCVFLFVVSCSKNKHFYFLKLNLKKCKIVDLCGGVQLNQNGVPTISHFIHHLLGKTYYLG